MLEAIQQACRRSSIEARQDFGEVSRVIVLVSSVNRIGTKIRELEHSGVAATRKIRYVYHIAYVAMSSALRLKTCQEVPVVLLVRLINNQQPLVLVIHPELPNKECVEPLANILKSIMKDLKLILNGTYMHCSCENDKTREPCLKEHVINRMQ